MASTTAKEAEMKFKDAKFPHAYQLRVLDWTEEGVLVEVRNMYQKPQSESYRNIVLSREDRVALAKRLVNGLGLEVTEKPKKTEKDMLSEGLDGRFRTPSMEKKLPSHRPNRQLRVSRLPITGGLLVHLLTPRDDKEKEAMIIERDEVVDLVEFLQESLAADKFSGNEYLGGC